MTKNSALPFQPLLVFMRSLLSNFTPKIEYMKWKNG